MLPLESFETGVPCVTGNNNHYFKEGILHKYTVVENEENAEEIKEKILMSVKNRDSIMNEYKIFRKNNIFNSKNDVEEFLQM